jgi:phosphoribosylformimino-5-aminoimidazole carboxamide ribotide isomerase
VRSFFDHFGPDRITLALDVMLLEQVPIVATSGWTEASSRTLWEVAEHYPEAQNLMVTDIARDGTMGGPNVELIHDLTRRLPGVSIQASGGVASLEDIDSLIDAGAAGAIVGKAIWERKFTVSEAIARAGT